MPILSSENFDDMYTCYSDVTVTEIMVSQSLWNCSFDEICYIDKIWNADSQVTYIYKANKYEQEYLDKNDLAWELNIETECQILVSQNNEVIYVSIDFIPYEEDDEEED